MAVRTREGPMRVIREGLKVVAWWVMEEGNWRRRKMTSGQRPEVGQIRWMWAEAERRWTMRVAATWREWVRGREELRGKGEVHSRRRRG